MVDDSVGDQENLTARMLVPGIIHTGLEDDVVDAGSSRCVVGLQGVGQQHLTRERGQLQERVAGSKHADVGAGVMMGIFLHREVVVGLVGDGVVSVGISRCRLPVLVVDDNLLKPVARRGPVPVACPGRDVQHIALAEHLRCPTLLLVDAHAASDKDVHAAVAVPVAVGTRREGDDIGRREVINAVLGDDVTDVSLAYY